jgi:hypothetical protein
VWVVPRRDHSAVAGAHPEVVLGDLPHRAWEQSRAAASGRSAVTIVERVVTVPAGPPTSAPKPRQLAWVDLLRELATQIEEGAVNDRHLPAIAAALDDVLRAVHQRCPRVHPVQRPWGDTGVT